MRPMIKQLKKGCINQGKPTITVIFNIAATEEERVMTVLDLANLVAHETIQKKLKGTTLAQVIPLRKVPLTK